MANTNWASMRVKTNVPARPIPSPMAVRTTPWPHDQTQDSAAFGAESHADADLLGALGD
jgi:hypothetical protein